MKRLSSTNVLLNIAIAVNVGAFIAAVIRETLWGVAFGVAAVGFTVARALRGAGK